MRGMIKKISGALFILVGLLMFYGSYDNWQSNQEFIHSSKGRSLGTVHVERGVETVSFPENSYGVALDGEGRKEGEQVYIYYQKDKPYRISTTPSQYKTKEEIYGAFLSGIFFIGYVIFIQFIAQKIWRKFAQKHHLLKDGN